MTPRKLIKALSILTVILLASIVIGFSVGSQRIDFSLLFSDSVTHTLFFRLRLPRVLMGLVIGASLALTGAALQALFRNPLADPYTLGVSGGPARSALAEYRCISPSPRLGRALPPASPWCSSHPS